MTQSRLTHERVDWGRIAMASVLLVGIVTVTVGYLQESRIALDAGLVITMLGVVTGIRQVLGGGSRR